MFFHVNEFVKSKKGHFSNELNVDLAAISHDIFCYSDRVVGP